MKQILLANGLLRETIATKIMLYNNTKVKVHSPDRDTDYLCIVVGVLQGDTLASYLFIICIDNVLQTSIDLMKENGFMLAIARSRRYSAQTILDTDFWQIDLPRLNLCYIVWNGQLVAEAFI